MGSYKKEIIDRIKVCTKGLYLTDTHTVMCKYFNIDLEGQKKDSLTKHTPRHKNVPIPGPSETKWQTTIVISFQV